MVRAHIGTIADKKFYFNLDSLTRHAAIMGTTGSGKTVLGKVLLEEAMSKGIPIIAIDPKGDIGSIAIKDKDFDFRPFSKGSKESAKLAQQYAYYTKSQNVVLKAEDLSKTKTTIFTPKSNSGIQLSILPTLALPEGLDKVSDTAMLNNFIEATGESIVQLAEISSAKSEKAQSLICAIISNAWQNKNNLDFPKLINQIIAPPFDTIGSMPVEDFLKETDRRSIAASINLILSSPSKRAWAQGETLDMSNLLMLNKVSVMDLRFIQSLQDKQFFVTEVLSALYFHLIKMGGSEKLRYILYVDELAGLLPPPPAIPPCKKMLELLIRQARAFGLGVVIATQSPGDIDYRIFSNVGTRFIGRLRTEIEMSKVAAAMSLSPGEMMPIISKLSTGEFVYNDAVKNSRKVISARWLVTYHGGPLKDEEIRWVNNPNEISKPIKKLKVVKFTPKKKKVHEVEESISKSRAYLKKGKKHEKRTVKSGLNTILDKIKRYADKVQTKIVHTKAEQYVPHLRIVITPKEINGIEFDMQGPYIFDLTSKMIPLGNYLSHVTWSTIVNPNVKIKKAKMSIQKAFDYAVYDACSKLKKRYYTSSIIKYASISRNDVVVKNKQELESKVEHRLKVLQLKTQRQINRIDNSIDENNKKIGKYLLILNYKKTHGFLKKIFLKKAAPKTKRMRQIERIYAKLWSENKVLRSKMNKLEKEYVDKSKKILQKITIDANTHVKERIYVPKRKNMLISSTLLLVAKDKSEV